MLMGCRRYDVDTRFPWVHALNSPAFKKLGIEGLGSTSRALACYFLTLGYIYVRILVEVAGQSRIVPALPASCLHPRTSMKLTSSKLDQSKAACEKRSEIKSLLVSESLWPLKEEAECPRGCRALSEPAVSGVEFKLSRLNSTRPRFRPLELQFKEKLSLPVDEILCITNSEDMAIPVIICRMAACIAQPPVTCAYKRCTTQSPECTSP
jgi:hypothetical protein